jgi:hypothetical protein
MGRVDARIGAGSRNVVAMPARQGPAAFELDSVNLRSPEREGNVLIAGIERQRYRPLVEAVIRDVGVLDAARRGRVGSATIAGAGRPIIVRTAKVVDEGVVPIARELADNCRPRAPRIDPIVKVLGRGEVRIGVDAGIGAEIEMQPAGERDGILPVRILEDEAFVGRLRYMTCACTCAFTWFCSDCRCCCICRFCCCSN